MLFYLWTIMSIKYFHLGELIFSLTTIISHTFVIWSIANMHYRSRGWSYNSLLSNNLYFFQRTLSNSYLWAYPSSSHWPFVNHFLDAASNASATSAHAHYHFSTRKTNHVSCATPRDSLPRTPRAHSSFPLAIAPTRASIHPWCIPSRRALATLYRLQKQTDESTQASGGPKATAWYCSSSRSSARRSKAAHPVCRGLLWQSISYT